MSTCFVIPLSAPDNFEMSQVFYMKAMCKTVLVLTLLLLPIKVSEASYMSSTFVCSLSHEYYLC